MIVTICHDDDCPLGINGMFAYHEARVAMSHCRATPEAMETAEDRQALSEAEHDLETSHRCTCGCDDLLKDSETRDGILYLTIAGMDKLGNFVRLKP